MSAPGVVAVTGLGTFLGRGIAARLLVREGRAPDRAAAVALMRQMPRAEQAALLRGTDSETLLRLYVTEETEGFPNVPDLLADGTVLLAN